MMLLRPSCVNSTNPEFKKHTQQFLSQWRDIFSRTLGKEPAHLPPMELKVDARKWETRRSQGPPRVMSIDKERHLRNFIEESLANDIIRPSTSNHYSQVHLVPKPQSLTLPVTNLLGGEPRNPKGN